MGSKFKTQPFNYFNTWTTKNYAGIASAARLIQGSFEDESTFVMAGILPWIDEFHKENLCSLNL